MVPETLIPAPPAMVAGPPEPAEPAELPTLPGSPSWVNLLMWLLGSLGLTGVLAVCGFILHTGSENFWGYELSRVSATDYVALFGELLYAGFSDTLQWAGEAWWHLPLVLAAVAAGVVLWVRIPDRFYHPRVLFLALGVLALANFSWTDVPSFFIRDMLMDVGTAGVQSADGMVRGRAEALRERHICARMTETAVAADADASLEVTCTERPARYRQALRNAFILNLMLGVVNLLALVAGAMWLVGGGGREFNRTREGRTWRLVLVAAAALLLVDVATVPYHYAKTARPTEVHKVVVRVAGEGPAESINGFLLSDGPDRLVLYNEESWDVWTLPQGNVAMIVLRDPADVLSFHIGTRTRGGSE